MDLNNLLITVSITSSIISIILAVFAIWFSMRVEHRLKRNFLRLKEIMELSHEKSESCLSNIDKEAEAIKNTVSTSQSQLLENLERILEDYEPKEK